MTGLAGSRWVSPRTGLILDVRLDPEGEAGGDFRTLLGRSYWPGQDPESGRAVSLTAGLLRESFEQAIE